MVIFLGDIFVVVGIFLLLGLKVLILMECFMLMGKLMVVDFKENLVMVRVM